jgi:hypothetical protein
MESKSKPSTPEPVTDVNLLQGLLSLALTECKIIRLRFLLFVSKTRHQIITFLLDTRDLCALALGYEYVDCEECDPCGYDSPQWHEKQRIENHEVSDGLKHQPNDKNNSESDKIGNGVVKYRGNVASEKVHGEIVSAMDSKTSAVHSPADANWPRSPIYLQLPEWFRESPRRN